LSKRSLLRFAGIHSSLRAKRARVGTNAPIDPLRPGRRRVWLFDLDDTLHDASHAIFRKSTGA